MYKWSLYEWTLRLPRIDITGVPAEVGGRVCIIRHVRMKSYKKSAKYIIMQNPSATPNSLWMEPSILWRMRLSLCRRQLDQSKHRATTCKQELTDDAGKSVQAWHQQRMIWLLKWVRSIRVQRTLVENNLINSHTGEKDNEMLLDLRDISPVWTTEQTTSAMVHKKKFIGLSEQDR